jgi:hypothetical protein
LPKACRAHAKSRATALEPSRETEAGSMMTTDEKIVYFFAPPSIKVPTHIDRVSTLYLLRREIQDCLFGKVISEDQAVGKRGRHRLFATAMVIFAGIDLLAKFYAGSDAQGEVRQRFRRFAIDFLFRGTSSAELFAEVLYLGCRNPMMHSFGLHNRNYGITVLHGMPRAGAVLEVPGHADHFVINIEGLFRVFVNGVGRYRAALQSDPNLRNNFERMFEQYSTMGFVKVRVGESQDRYVVKPAKNLRRTTAQKGRHPR